MGLRTAQKRPIRRTHDDPRGNQPDLTKEFLIEVCNNSNLTYNDIIRAFNIMSRNIWFVRTRIWETVHQASKWVPKEDHKDVDLLKGNRAKIWQMPLKRANEMYWD